MIPEYSLTAQKRPRRRGTDPAGKECGGGDSLLDMIDAAETQATGHSKDSRRRKKSPRKMKEDLRGWSYKARLALKEKGAKNVDCAQFKRTFAVMGFEVYTDCGVSRAM